ncbi:hypothetical protein C8J57DRAFT_1468047, partial [Mycena rebaudengoi]
MHSRVHPLHLLSSHFALPQELRFLRAFSSPPAFSSSYVLLAGLDSVPTRRLPWTMPSNVVYVEILDLHHPPFRQLRATRAQLSPASQPPVLPSLVVILGQISWDACTGGNRPLSGCSQNRSLGTISAWWVIHLQPRDISRVGPRISPRPPISPLLLDEYRVGSGVPRRPGKVCQAQSYRQVSVPGKSLALSTGGIRIVATRLRPLLGAIKAGILDPHSLRIFMPSHSFSLNAFPLSLSHNRPHNSRSRLAGSMASTPMLKDLHDLSLGCSLSRSSNTCPDPVEPSTSLFTLKAKTMLVLVESLLIPSPTRYSKFCFDWSRVKHCCVFSPRHIRFKPRYYGSTPENRGRVAWCFAVTMDALSKISDGSPTLSKTKAMPMYLEQNHFSKAVHIAVLPRGSWDSEATMSTLLWMLRRCYFYLIFAYREISDGITRPLGTETMAVYLEPQIYAPESRNYCCIARSHAVPFPQARNPKTVTSYFEDPRSFIFYYTSNWLVFRLVFRRVPIPHDDPIHTMLYIHADLMKMWLD